MLNASLWSSSKKLSVAKNFLFNYKKNVLLHTKVKEGNNIDIHLEKLSQFPEEEEILFLPYCYFEVKSFTKVKENNLEYYDLELVYCEEENESNEIEKMKVIDFKLKV
jgi:transposase